VCAGRGLPWLKSSQRQSRIQRSRKAIAIAANAASVTAALDTHGDTHSHDTHYQSQEKNLNQLIQAAIGIGLAAILFVSCPCDGVSQTSTPTPAVHDGQHDFDFNIGVWRTHIKRTLDPFASSSESVELNGTVTVRKVWDGKAELEEIEADSPKGHWEGLTLFLYNPSAHQWSQTFANSKVGTLSSNVGEFKDGRVVLTGQDTVNDKTILVRAVWSDIKPDSHQYEESYSNDGGMTWARSFIANLTRLKQ
jgi:hypothetical protein